MKKTETEKILANDISRYKKNKLGSGLALLGLVFNCLYFMLLYAYKSSIEVDTGKYTKFCSMEIGFSVLLTLVMLLLTFLSSEGVKGYNKKFCIVLLVLAAFQIFRIFGYPLYGLRNKLLTVNYFGLNPDTPGVNEIEFTILLVYLLASAACLIASAVISYLRIVQLKKYNESIQNGEFNIDEFLANLDKEEASSVTTDSADQFIETAKEEN